MEMRSHLNNSEHYNQLLSQYQMRVILAHNV
jgi:hypothetical protein